MIIFRPIYNIWLYLYMTEQTARKTQITVRVSLSWLEDKRMQNTVKIVTIVFISYRSYLLYNHNLLHKAYVSRHNFKIRQIYLKNAENQTCIKQTIGKCPAAAAAGHQRNDSSSFIRTRHQSSKGPWAGKRSLSASSDPAKRRRILSPTGRGQCNSKPSHIPKQGKCDLGGDFQYSVARGAPKREVLRETAQWNGKRSEQWGCCWPRVTVLP